jgi:DNA-binding FrmR family transcriptional regulator
MVMLGTSTDGTRAVPGRPEGVLSMVDNGGRRPDVTKQLPAAQGLIECTSREVSRPHLEPHLRAAFRDGRRGGVVTLLLETLEYDRHVLRATP